MIKLIKGKRGLYNTTNYSIVEGKIVFTTDPNTAMNVIENLVGHDEPADPTNPYIEMEEGEYIKMVSKSFAEDLRKVFSNSLYGMCRSKTYNNTMSSIYSELKQIEARD